MATGGRSRFDTKDISKLAATGVFRFDRNLPSHRKTHATASVLVAACVVQPDRDLCPGS